MGKTFLKSISIFLWGGTTMFCLTGFTTWNDDGATRYFLNQTIQLETKSVKKYVIEGEEKGTTDTLYQNLSEEGIPVSYYRKISRSVCFDNKCRPLKLNIYWNITGRYLGFELPAGEFLSKTEHVPFEPSEYQQLNKLLKDSLSRLSEFSLSDVTPKAEATGLKLDGITSATSKDVADYVVKGAGYTTYTMWHLIYGPTQDKVMELTKKKLNPTLLLAILQSKEPWDTYWAMEHLPDHTPLPTVLEKQILSRINDTNFSLAENAIRSLKPIHLGSISLQEGLCSRFDSVGYSLKNGIILKLMDAPMVHASLRLKLAQQLSHANGELFINILGVLKKHQIYDQEVVTTIGNLLDSTNRFISNKSYEFLKHADINDEQLKKKLKEYELTGLKK